MIRIGTEITFLQFFGIGLIVNESPLYHIIRFFGSGSYAQLPYDLPIYALRFWNILDDTIGNVQNYNLKQRRQESHTQIHLLTFQTERNGSSSSETKYRLFCCAKCFWTSMEIALFGRYCITVAVTAGNRFTQFYY